MSDGYRRQRVIYQDVSGSLVVTTATTTSTLVALKANYTTYVQRIDIQVTTGSATTWSVRDDNSTVVDLTGTLDVSTAPTHFQIDLGPIGVPITQAKNLKLVIGAAGAAGTVSWDGYQKLTGVAGDH